MDMKKLFILALTLILAGCGQPESREKEISVLTETTEEIAENRDEEKEPSKRDSLAEEAESPAANSDSTVSPTQLEVCFGDDGEPLSLIHI